MKGIFRGVALALAVGLAGCDETVGWGGPSLVGTYELRSVNGASLPVTVPGSESATVQWTGGTLTLSAERTFLQRTEQRVSNPANGQVSTSVLEQTGTYVRNGVALEMVYDPGTRASGGVADNAVTVRRGDQSFVFTR